MSENAEESRFRKQALWVIVPLAVVELFVIAAIIVKIVG